MEERNLPLNSKERVDHRLKKNKHFGYIYKKGRRLNSKHFVLYFVPSKFKSYKLGISISKKLGKANVRNKLKRRTKEVIRINNLPKDYFNYVLVAKQGAELLDYAGIEKEIKELFK